jgi:DNA polymerase-3 subunit delta'
MPSRFSDLLIHPLSAKQLDMFADQPGHGLLISGSDRSGKIQAAELLAASLLGVDATELQKYPHFYLITKQDGKSEISIDAARELVSKLSLKVPSDRSINRIALIQDAENLSNEAQNALLKMLEEPPAGSLIILTASSAGGLLPTVASRLQKIPILPVSLEQSLSFFDGQYSPAKIDSAWRLSRGAAALMSDILSDDSAPLKLAVDDAKNFLKMNPYQRLTFLQQTAKDKAQLELVLQALSRVLAALNHSNIEAGRQAASDRLLKARKLVGQTQDALADNANTRLAALNLVLNMPL